MNNDNKKKTTQFLFHRQGSPRRDKHYLYPAFSLELGWLCPSRSLWAGGVHSLHDAHSQPRGVPCHRVSGFLSPWVVCVRSSLYRESDWETSAADSQGGFHCITFPGLRDSLSVIWNSGVELLHVNSRELFLSKIGCYLFLGRLSCCWKKHVTGKVRSGGSHGQSDTVKAPER